MIKTFPLSSRAKTTALKQPKELFSYARDINGEFEYDSDKAATKLCHYYFPDADIDKGIDLGAGFKDFKKIPEEENLGDFESLLKSIIIHEKKTGEKVSADIVTFRGLMTKLLALPYNMKDPIDFHATVYDGQIFIKNDEEVELKRRQAEPQDPSKKDYIQRCEYSGYKFEAVTTLSKPWSESTRLDIEKRNTATVNNYEQFISVVRTGIGKVKLLLAGEVDCLWDYRPLDPKQDVLPHYMELKTSRAIETPGNVVTFERKLFKTWAQSFLIGIRKVVYGFRDDNLILRCVEVYQTEEIPILLKKNDIGDPSKKIVCMNALKWYGAVVEWLTEVIPKDNRGAYRISYDPGSRSFSVSELIGDDKAKVQGMISDEFVNWRAELQTVHDQKEQNE